MRSIWAIFKKEWDRVIKDKRLILTVMILPGLMIFLIYTFMGTALQSMEANLPSQVALVNPPQSFVDLLAGEAYSKWTIETIESDEIPQYKNWIDNGTWQYLIYFPASFEVDINLLGKPTAHIYYNQNEMASSVIYQSMQSVLYIYHQVWVNHRFGDTTIFEMDFQSIPLDENKQQGQMMAMLLPMLTIMFLFSGAMAIGPESIAGEKERNTIATLLVTPVKRSQIAIGKVLSLSVLSLLSALSSFIGIITSLPKLMQSNHFDMSIYSFTDYLQILLLLFSTVFVIVGIIAIVSAYAKNLKEAGTLIMPFYILTILVGVTSLFGSGANSNFFAYLIPIYNTVQSLTAILTFEPQTWMYVSITIVANIGYLVFFVLLLSVMFQNEKIMFAK